MPQTLLERESPLSEEASPPKVSPADSLVAGNGARVTRTLEAGAEAFALTAADGRLVLRYRPESDSLELLAPGGGVTLAAPDGDLDLRAAGRVRISGREVAIEADRTSLTGRLFTVSADRIGLVANAIETAAGRMIERFRNLYRTVEGAQQVRAGRLRTQVEGHMRVRAGSLATKADGDVSIDGDKIRLG